MTSVADKKKAKPPEPPIPDPALEVATEPPASSRWLAQIRQAHRMLTRPELFLAGPPERTSVKDLQSVRERLDPESVDPANFFHFMTQKAARLFVHNKQADIMDLPVDM